jgi:two-component system, cell cycle sensor histidine kinase and response regulator CckA
VVDDDVAVSQLVAALLESEGFFVLIANNGPDALRLAEEQPARIDLLVTDVVMPRMDGPTLAREIQSIAPGLPVVLMSGACDASALQSAGFCHFLQKPFSPANLLQVVQSAVAVSKPL